MKLTGVLSDGNKLRSDVCNYLSGGSCGLEPLVTGSSSLSLNLLSQMFSSPVCVCVRLS